MRKLCETIRALKRSPNRGNADGARYTGTPVSADAVCRRSPSVSRTLKSSGSGIRRKAAPDTFVRWHIATIERALFSCMASSRRRFIQSLCASASVFSFDQLVGAADPGLGVQFLNVAREAGLRTKTIFGGDRKNRYLLETTGCGVRLLRLRPRRLAGHLSGQRHPLRSQVGRRRRADQPALQEQSGRHVHGRDARLRPGPHRVGPGLSASAITTTTATTICSSRIGAIAPSTTTTGTASSPMSRARPAWQRPGQRPA